MRIQPLILRYWHFQRFLLLFDNPLRIRSSFFPLCCSSFYSLLPNVYYVANNVTETDFERFWMRDPEQQFKEMWQFYHDVFPFVLADLADMVLADSADEPIESGGRANPSGLDAFGSDLFSEIGWIDSSGLRGETPVLIAEGIAFLPSLLHGIGIPPEHCVFLTAERGVHVERYAKRDWTHLMLEGCNDKVCAFDLWMQRDELFAAAVRAECAELGYSHVFVQ